MSRAGQWKRKENQIRLVEIWNSVSFHHSRKGYATVTDVANDLNMTRSTYLKNLIFKLVHSDKIDVKIHMLIDGRESYRFYFSEEKLKRLKDSCAAPWICDGEKTAYAHSVCIKTTHGKTEYCPVLLIRNEKRRKLYRHGSGTVALRNIAKKLVQ